VLRADEHAFTHIFALHAAREGDTHRADQVRILAVGLGDASPSGIARHVHDRGARVEHARGAHLTPHDVGHLL